MTYLQRTGIAGLLFTSLIISIPGSVMAVAGRTAAEPLFTKYARIYRQPTLSFRSEFFTDKPMEEMIDFDGYTLSLDFAWPFSDQSQLRVLLPFYTNGDGIYDKPGQRNDGLPLDVEGYNGVRDFFSLIYERRFGWLENTTGSNVAWLVGFGRSMDPLDAEYDGDLIDRFNHRGNNAQIGLKLDHDVSGDDLTLLGNLRLTVFWDTDDINLSGGATSFQVLTASGAVKFNRYGHFNPVLEAIFEADFEDYTALTLAPEAIYTVGDDFDVKLGVPFRLTTDGQKYAIDLELTYRF
jgi:hypothetical protein